MPPERIPRARRFPACRSAKGKGWHQKGRRDNGCMWINVRSEGCTKGQDVQENESLQSFVDSLEDQPDTYIVPNVWCDVFYKRTSLFKIAEDHPHDTVNQWFDGGETVYRKFYDMHAREMDDLGKPTKRVHKDPRFIFDQDMRHEHGRERNGNASDSEDDSRHQCNGSNYEPTASHPTDRAILMDFGSLANQHRLGLLPRSEGRSDRKAAAVHDPRRRLATNRRNQATFQSLVDDLTAKLHQLHQQAIALRSTFEEEHQQPHRAAELGDLLTRTRSNIQKLRRSRASALENLRTEQRAEEAISTEMRTALEMPDTP